MRTPPTLLAALFSASLLAQVPQAINYQAVARDAGGVLLVNQSIAVRMTITDGNGGATLYRERHTPTTNAFGVFNLTVGAGTVLNGVFANIDWAGTQPWLQVEMDPNGGTAYVLMGSQQLMSVPYALHAANSADNAWQANGNDISNTNSGNVGVGTATPAANIKLNVAGRVAPDWGSSNDATYRFGDGTENTGFASPNPNELVVVTNGNETMRVAGSGNVGIGTSNPQADLDVNGTVRVNDGTQGESKVLTSDAIGNASWVAPPSAQAAFWARLESGPVTVSGSAYPDVPFDSVYVNSGSAYDESTKIFLAPSAGLYQFHVSVTYSADMTGYSEVLILKETSPSKAWVSGKEDPQAGESMNVSAICFLNAGEVVRFLVDSGSALSGGGFQFSRTYAYGYKLF